jgi:hypothetical protein
MADMSAGHDAEVNSSTEHGVPIAVPQIKGGGKQKKEEGDRPELAEHVRMRIQPSPAPFSRYRTSVEHEDHEGRSRLPAGLTTAEIKTPAISGNGRIAHGGEDEPSEGCCKCVIM